jgi:hypothetical protein
MRFNWMTKLGATVSVVIVLALGITFGFHTLNAQEAGRSATLVLRQTVPASITFPTTATGDVTVTLPISLELDFLITVTSVSSAVIAMTPSDATLQIVQLASKTTPENSFLTEPKRPGFYLVGTSIAPGTWMLRTNGDDSCYYKRTDELDRPESYGTIVDKSVITVLETDYALEVTFCDNGVLEYVPAGATSVKPVETAISQPTEEPASTEESKVVTESSIENKDFLTEPKMDGNYIVGVSIAPGVWQLSEQPAEGYLCMYQRLDKNEQPLDMSVGLKAGSVVTVRETDYAVVFSVCGVPWVYVRPLE